MYYKNRIFNTLYCDPCIIKYARLWHFLANDIIQKSLNFNNVVPKTFFKTQFPISKMITLCSQRANSSKGPKNWPKAGNFLEQQKLRWKYLLANACCAWNLTKTCQREMKAHLSFPDKTTNSSKCKSVRGRWDTWSSIWSSTKSLLHWWAIVSTELYNTHNFSRVPVSQSDPRSWLLFSSFLSSECSVKITFLFTYTSF